MGLVTDSFKMVNKGNKMFNRVYKWYDALEEPRRMLTLLAVVAPSFFLASFAKTAIFGWTILAVLLITRLYYLYKS